LFKRYLEGKVLSEELVEYVLNHENKWLRNVFRHYIQYLYYMRRIPPETYGWLMEVVPSRGYRLDVRPYPISLEDVAKTLKHLEEEHELYYLVYRLMLEGGLRLSHALLLVKSFNPGEVVEVNGLGIDTPRLVCFEEKGFCRYYMGVRGLQSPTLDLQVLGREKDNLYLTQIRRGQGSRSAFKPLSRFTSGDITYDAGNATHNMVS
jgi:intergrase/recombinase